MKKLKLDLRMFETLAFYIVLLLMPVSIYWPLGPPVTTRVFALFVSPQFYLTDILLLFISLLTLFNRNRWPNLRDRANGSLAGLVLLAVLSTAFSRFLVLGVPAALRLVLVLGYFAALNTSRVKTTRLIKVFIVGVLLQALLGMGQYAVQGPLGLPFEFAIAPAWGGAAIVETAAGRLLRAYGLTFHPNVLGGFLLVGATLSLALISKWRYRLAFWLLLSGLLLTFSRSAWLAGAVTLPVVSFWIGFKEPKLRRPMLGTILISLLLVVVISVLLAAPIRTRLLLNKMETERASITTRVGMFDTAWELIQDNPILGVGPGQYSAEVVYSYPGRKADPVHNVPALILSELGALGGLCWLGLFVQPGLRFFQNRKAQSGLSGALLGTCLALGVISMFDHYPWGLESGRLLTVTMIALLVREVDSIPSLGLPSDREDN